MPGLVTQRNAGAGARTSVAPPESSAILDPSALRQPVSPALRSSPETA